jgi:dienelactone hydrolase
MSNLFHRQAAMSCATLALTLAFTQAAPAQSGKAPTNTKTVTTFASNGQNVGLWLYEPTKPGPHPALILLHGVEGLGGVDQFADKYDMVGRSLADKGYVVYFVHYFDRTRRDGDDVKALETDIKTMLVGGGGNNNANRNAEVRSLFRHWMAAAGDAIKFARRQPNVDGERVGLVGFSLGAYVALSTTVDDPDLRVAAVVELFGGLPRELLPKVAKMPPVLIIHGERDSIVPVKEAYDLRTVLKAKKNHVEEKFYDCDHMFFDREQFNMFQAMSAQNLAVRFLDKHLGRK